MTRCRNPPTRCARLSHNLNTLKGVRQGIIYLSIKALLKGDPRSLDPKPSALNLILGVIMWDPRSLDPKSQALNPILGVTKGDSTSLD